MEEPRTRGAGGRKADPADVRQLEEHPVSGRRILALLSPYRRRILIVISLIVAGSTISLASPFLLRAAIDHAIPQQDVALLIALTSGMVAVAAATGILGVLQTWLSTMVGQEVLHGLRSDVFSHLQRQSLAFFTRTRGGEVQSRLTHDIGGLQSVVTSTATSIAANLTTVVGTSIAMVALSWRLSLLSLVVLPPAIWLTRRVARLRREITGQRQRRLADLHAQVEEGLSVSGVMLSKTLGTGPVLADTFRATSSDLVGLELRSQLAGRWRMATMSIIFAAIPAAIYLAAGLPATSSGMTIGTLVAFTTLQGALFRPLIALLNVGVDVTSSLALFSRIFAYLDLPVDVREPEEPVAVDHETFRGHVHLTGVSFRYESDGDPALADIDLVVPAGTSLAIVGATGSGKSTLAGLVARLHDPTEGMVTLDGVDLRDLSLADVAALVGVVSQETYLLHTTIRENLRIARPDASDDQLVDAAKAAQIHELIERLPDGYDTVVGARGYRFSGGEKQRLALARTLLRDPRVLVLDEATSALDNHTERHVQEALDRLRAGRTTITIAHRLSTVREADQIAVLERGRIVEIGGHDELLARQGAYARLHGQLASMAA